MDDIEVQGVWGPYHRLEDLPKLQREHYEVARSFGDRWVSFSEFKGAYRRLYPGRLQGSILPADHVVGNPSAKEKWAKFLEWRRPPGHRHQYRFIGLPPRSAPSDPQSPFVIGQQYTRIEVQALLGLPEPANTGRWSTGYTRQAGVFIVFANVGVAGRTGHDYPNRWLPDGRMAWEAKRPSRRGQPEIEALLAPETPVHVFWREEDRAPFTYAGQARAEEVEASSPVRLVWRFPSSSSGDGGRTTPTEQRTRSSGRVPFVRAPRPSAKDRRTARVVMQRDPSLLDRALDAHGDIQEALAKFARDAGYEPDWKGAPDVDLAWLDGAGVLNVVEVKSITDANEVAQLRLGLGQVLHYAAELRLREPDRRVRPILAVEQAPANIEVWRAACEAAGVVLTWGPDFVGAVPTPS